MAEPLAQRSFPALDSADLVQRLPPLARFVLRGRHEVLTAAGAAVGLAISQQACRSARSGARAALWLGPDEQLLLAPQSDAAELVRALGESLAGKPHSLVDISHRQLALQLTGREAATVLNVGCPLDLDLSAFPVGMCTRTILGKSAIVLWRTASESFHLEVWRSFAAYVVSFLNEAAREFAC